VPPDDEKGPADEVLEIDLEPLDDEAPRLAPSPSAPVAAKASARPVGERAASRLAAPPPPKPVNEAREAVPLRRTASPWTKRLAVMGGLVAAALFAAISSENWIPKAVPSVRIKVSEADVVKQSRER